MAKHILITGGTGLVGTKLIPALQASGHQVSILSRKKVSLPNVKCYEWNVYEGTINRDAVVGIDTIIHLAGEGIADKKWTDERKKEIIDSRIESTKLLFKAIRETDSQVKSFITASAVGYYGDRGNEILSEDSKPGEGFLAETCVLWENAANEGIELGIRVVKIRIGLILSRDGGALPAFKKPISLFLGAPLGSGKQWMPWVHIDDIVGLFLKAAEDEEMIDAYNGCAPFPVTNKLMTKAIAGKLNRPVWPIHVPKVALKALMGELSILPLMSNNTFAQKLLKTGFKFKYVNLDDALNDVLK